MLTDLRQGASASASIERSLAIARELGDADQLGRAYHNAIEILAISGHDRRALELVTDGVAQSEAMGTTAVWGAYVSLHAATVAFDLGAWDQAASFIEASRSSHRPPAAEAYALVRTVGLAVGRGDFESARAMLARIRDLLPLFHLEYQQTGPYACAEAELALWEASPRRAMAVIEESLVRLEQTDDACHRIRLLRLGMRAAADLAQVARDRHDAPSEAEAIALAATLRHRCAPVLATIAGMDGGLELELRAEQATVAAEETRLNGASDPAAWDLAAELWQARERPYQQAYARYRSAEASLAHGDRQRARPPLREAERIAAGLGARPLHAEIAALARRGRIPIEQPDRSEDRPAAVRPDSRDDLGLTPREREVLELIAEGMTNRQIAANLFISGYTVGVHVSHILGKLGVRSRTEAASAAYRLGLVAR